MNTKIRMAALAVAATLSGTSQAALYDRGGGLIYDSVLNVTWMKDVSYVRTTGYDADGFMTWYAANTWTDNLAYYDSVRGVTYTDWRLPKALPVNGVSYNATETYNGTTDVGWNITSTRSELAYLRNVTLGNPTKYNTSGALTGCYVDGFDSCLNNAGPFINFAYGDAYEFPGPSIWTGATVVTVGIKGIKLYTATGLQTATTATIESGMPWAVRDGDIANLAPVAVIGGPYSILQGQNLSLSGIGSYDADYVTDFVTELAWDLNNDNIYDAFGTNADVSFSTLAGLGLGAGTHTITLRVRDNKATYGFGTTTLTIAAVPESETYAMMLAGLGLVGWAARRRG